MPETKIKNPDAEAPREDQAAPASDAALAQDDGGEPGPDRAWQQSEKPALSDQDRMQGLEPEQLRRMMYDMLLARRFEEKVAESYALGKIGGFCHLYIGQEAVAVGAIHALRKDDYVMTAYREHVHALQCGITPAP
jgi:pyruvate dehydrogenase E1 component alpha subunit